MTRTKLHSSSSASALGLLLSASGCAEAAAAAAVASASASAFTCCWCSCSRTCCFSCRCLKLSSLWLLASLTRFTRSSLHNTCFRQRCTAALTQQMMQHRLVACQRRTCCIPTAAGYENTSVVGMTVLCWSFTWQLCICCEQAVAAKEQRGPL